MYLWCIGYDLLARFTYGNLREGTMGMAGLLMSVEFVGQNLPKKNISIKKNSRKSELKCTGFIHTCIIVCNAMVGQ